MDKLATKYIDEAERLLKSVGAEYVIVKDGEQRGTLTLAAPEPVPMVEQPHKRKFSPHVNHWSKEHRINSRIGALTLGTGDVFMSTTGVEDLPKLQGAIAGCCSRFCAKHNRHFTTMQDKALNAVLVYCVEPPPESTDTQGQQLPLAAV